MKNRLKMKLNILMLTLMLASTGCSSTNEYVEVKKANETEVGINDDKSTSTITIDDTIYMNDYNEYKSYLSELNPSYSLLRKTIKNNTSIVGPYEEAFLKIVDIFEENKVDTHNLAIFYENLKKEIINTDYTMQKEGETGVAATFTPDADQPCITVDDNIVEFSSFLHEVLHSCFEVIIRVDGKYIRITDYALEETVNNKGEIEASIIGLGFIEAKTVSLTNYFYDNSNNSYTRSYGYTNTSDIVDFVFDTQQMSLNSLFTLNTDGFKDILIKSGLSEDIVNSIMHEFDLQVRLETYEGFLTRELFYKNYIPTIVEKYIKNGYTSKEIYDIIGKSLKTSVIEDTHDINELIYYQKYLSNQKKLFDIIDELIANSLKKNNLETYSLYDFLGHEFEIYYSLYGKNVSLDNENIYLSSNWDREAFKNSNILVYVEDGEMKMCNYAKNPDGTISCYDYFGEISNIDNGTSFKILAEKEIITSLGGNLWFYYYLDDVKEAIISSSITDKYEIESIVNSNSYMYFSDGALTTASCTTNKEGEEIPYIVSDNKVYLLPENAIKIASLKELKEEGILTITEDNSYDIDSEKLTEYINNKRIKKRR